MHHPQSCRICYSPKYTCQQADYDWLNKCSRFTQERRANGLCAKSLGWHHMSVKASHFISCLTVCSKAKSGKQQRSNQSSVLLVFWAENPLVTNGFPTQMANNVQSMAKSSSTCFSHSFIKISSEISYFHYFVIFIISCLVEKFIHGHIFLGCSCVSSFFISVISPWNSKLKTCETHVLPPSLSDMLAALCIWYPTSLYKAW